MADLDKAKNNPKELIMDELHDVRACMLGSPDPKQHMQPMYPLPDDDGVRIWFFTHKDSDLVRTLSPSGDHQVHCCVIGKDRDFHACLMGSLREHFDASRRDQFWGPVTSAWFEGKDDPNFTMLEFVPSEAAIWASKGNPLSFAWQIARANLNEHKTPDMGVHKVVAY